MEGSAKRGLGHFDLVPLTSPSRSATGPFLSRVAGEDSERERLLLRSGRRKGPVRRSAAKRMG